ncbi:glutathione S-transferase kappa 1-like protein [Zopfochytrium polystomum]|nr:glutathione S-transferase kappa 1-like protein [Zopfochytrium polystomum]
MCRITFYYDVVSPYSWFAFETLLRYKPIWKVDVTLVPFFLGGVMNLSGNKPPATHPAKGAYMMSQDLPNLSKLYKVDLNFPVNFPEVSLKCQRILTAVRLEQPDKLEDASRSLWHLYWRDQQSMQDDANLLRYLAPIVGEPKAREYIAVRCNDKAIKDELMRVTTFAVESLGAFGAPLMVVEPAGGAGGNEERSSVVFGSDRFEVIAEMLGKPYLGAVPSVGGGSSTGSSSKL